MQQRRLFPLNGRLFAGFGLLLILLAMSAIVTYLNTQQLHEDSQWVTHTQEVIAASDDLLRAVVDAETGQRGYIITGVSEYLAPYESALAIIDDHIADLERLTADSQRHQERLESIEKSIAERLQILAEVIAVHDNRGFDAAKSELLSHRGKEEMDRVRAQLAEMTEIEQGLLFSRSAASNRSYQTAVAGGIGSAILGMAAVALLAYVVARTLDERQQAADALHHEREQLQITLTSIGDGVIATDPNGCVKMLNPIAEELTGWSTQEAAGRDLAEVFHIVNEATGAVVENPALRALEWGTIVGLANHTELIARDGTRRAIADSAAPIRGLKGEIHGAVLVFRDVAEHRRAEAELMDSRQFLEESLDALPAHIAVVDRDGVILLVNEAWREFARQNEGRSDGYGIGANYLEACEASGHGASCKDGDVAAKGIREVLSGKTAYFEMEYPCHGDHEDRWFLMRVSRFESSAGPRAIISHENISSRVKAEQGIRDSETNFRDLADNITQFAWMTDETGHIFWYNQQWFDYTGTTLDEMKGWGWRNVHHPDHVERVTAKFKQALETGEFWEDTFPLRSRTGKYRWFLSRARPIRDEEGNIIRWFGTNTDITELRELEQALVEVDKRKDQFLATLGHELRNPLAGILGGVEILESDTHDIEDQTEAQKIIGRQARFMQRLIDDLLDVSRIVRGKVTLNKTHVDVVNLVREVLQDCGRDLEDKGLETSLDVAEMPVTTKGDRERLRQVFTNLVHNATKFSEPGGCLKILIEKPQPSLCRVEIRDSGIGMSAVTLNEIFHPFVQADQSLERGRGGLGLGLAIVRGLIELHGGRVSATSEGLGQGSTFAVELPLVENMVELDGAPHCDVPNLSTSPLSILVIDDRRDASYPLIKFLEKDGHRVFTAEDGPCGVAEATAHLPDVVICDIGLPGFDGYEVARQLRSVPGLADSLFIAVTGYGQPQDRNDAVRAGFDCHIVKPVDRSLLMAHIASWEAERKHA